MNFMLEFGLLEPKFSLLRGTFIHFRFVRGKRKLKATYKAKLTKRKHPLQRHFSQATPRQTRL